MTFRSLDQIASDFRAIDPEFTRITNGNQLLGEFLVDHPMDEAFAATTGAGPVVFDLGVLDGPEWEGVRTLLDSQLVSQPARTELRQLGADLRATDTNGDRYLNNQEIVTFAQSHSDRYSTAALFRTAANSYLNRLPSYLAQPDLTDQQISRLWGTMNRYTQKWDEVGADAANRGTLCGLSLDGYPSTDQDNPPDLIRRAVNRQLTPEELGTVHQILLAPPLNPEEIGMLGSLLEGAARAGRTYQGMTILTGEQERQFFSERNEAVRRFRQELAAGRGNSAAIQVALQRITREMTRIEADHPERISATTLFLRAYVGDLNPAEVASLRDWIRTEAQTQGVTCNGAADCLLTGFIRFFQGIAQDPWHFIAHNGAFIGGAMLYKRFVLRRAFERRLTQACGGNGAVNPSQAYRDYQKFARQQARQNPLWRRLPRTVLQNPFVGLAIFNFGIAPAMDGILDGATGTRQHPVLDYATDGVGILAFEAFEAYDALSNSQIQQFARQNPGLCRPQRQEQTAPAPAPETVTAAETQTAQRLSDNLVRQMTQEQVGEYVRGAYGQWTEAQFGEAMNGASPMPTPSEIAQLPADLRPLFDADRHWGTAAEPQVQQLNSLMPRAADLLAQQYATGNPELAQNIRNDIRDIGSVLQDSLHTPEAEVSASVRWALRQYIVNLQAGGILRASFYMPMIREGGMVRTYTAIRASQESGMVSEGTEISFADGATGYYQMEADSLYNRLHPETWSQDSLSEGEFSTERDFMPRNSHGQPMIFILPLPALGIGALLEGLFGAGAVETTAPAWGQGAAAFAGAM